MSSKAKDLDMRYTPGQEIYYRRRAYMGGEEIYYGKSTVLRATSFGVKFNCQLPFGVEGVWIPIPKQEAKIRSIFDVTINDQELLKREFEFQSAHQEVG